MKVYLCYDSYNNYQDTWRRVTKVVSDERKAKEWVAELKPTEQESRFYVQAEVE